MARKYKPQNWIMFVVMMLTIWTQASFAQYPKDTDELTLAQQSLAEGKYQQAFEIFQKYAQEKDHPLAQFTLALFFQYGWGITQNEIMACQWFEKAAKKGVPAASHFFGECLQNGVHQPVDYKAAIHWYQEAANMGHTVSLCAIANLVMQGKGMEKNPLKALEYCEQAASAGSIPAQLQMGKFYLQGDQSIHHSQKAAAWYGYAAEKGSLEAHYHLGVINHEYFNDAEKALYWFETAASQGYSPAYYPTAKLYFSAPVSTETNKPSAEHLAKTYLWLSATQRQSKLEDELQATDRMLAKVLQIMPASWRPDLDKKIEQHFQQFHQ